MHFVLLIVTARELKNLRYLNKSRYTCFVISSIIVHNGSGVFFFFLFLAHNDLYKNHVVDKSHRVTKDKIYIGTLFMNPDFYCMEMWNENRNFQQ